MLDKGRIRRNKGLRRKLALYACIHEKWTPCEDTELKRPVLGFLASVSRERHEGR